MRWLAMDLHVHTVLSACADIEMIPPLIVERALQLGLGAIAVTDHNSVANAAAVRQAGAGSELVVLTGMELQTREEVHLLAILGDDAGASTLQAAVDEALPALPNRASYFGEQLLVDATGEYLAEDTRLRQTATSLSVEAAVAIVHEAGGICLAAHLDRPANSLAVQLGFVPPGLSLDGAEVSRSCDPALYAEGRSDLRDLTLVSFGDAHRLSEMVARTEFMVDRVSPEELRMALRAERGRRIRVRGGKTTARETRDSYGC